MKSTMRPAIPDALAQVGSEFPLLMLTHTPKGFIGDLVDAVPQFGVIKVIHPVRTKILVEQRTQAPRHPVGDMYTVGNVGDRYVARVLFLPKELPHFAGNITMQLGDCVASI